MTTTWKHAVAQLPIIGPASLIVYRIKTSLAYYRRMFVGLFRWWFTSNELANYTYDLEPTNQRYLAALLTQVLNVDHFTIERYINEAFGDTDLKLHISLETDRSDLSGQADAEARLGRRLGWYAIARAMKPRVIVETGLDKGLSSCVLTAALKRNTAEGHPGRYYGTDINPAAGYLLSGEYSRYGEILCSDSIESLAKFDQPIDLFINDSDHSADYEAAKYEMIADKLSNQAIILGDNATSPISC